VLDLVDPESGAAAYRLEHEIRSLDHPGFSCKAPEPKPLTLPSKGGRGATYPSDFKTMAQKGMLEGAKCKSGEGDFLSGHGRLLYGGGLGTSGDDCPRAAPRRAAWRRSAAFAWPSCSPHPSARRCPGRLAVRGRLSCAWPAPQALQGQQAPRETVCGLQDWSSARCARSSKRAGAAAMGNFRARTSLLMQVPNSVHLVFAT